MGAGIIQKSALISNPALKSPSLHDDYANYGKTSVVTTLVGKG
jgi:hypothetical protein